MFELRPPDGPELRHGADLAALLLDAQSDLGHGVVVTEGLRVVYANAAFARIVGYEIEELTAPDFDFRAIKLPSDSEPQGRLTHDGTGPSPRRFDMVLLRKDGARVRVEGSSKSVTHDGQTLRVSIVRDVTERRRAQRALLESAKAFSRAEKMATVEALVAALSHEIRTPLTYVTNGAFLVRTRIEATGDQALIDATRPHLEMIEQGVERADSLVDDLTSVADWTDEDADEVVTLDAVARGALGLLQRFRGENWKVDAALQPTPPVTADTARLHQAIIHLLRNARQSTDAADTRIRLVTRAHEATGEALLIVEDDGCGIPKEVQERMFDPLFTTSDERMGLGLSIVKSIVDDHGAILSCESTVGEGTRFTLRFPPKDRRNG